MFKAIARAVAATRELDHQSLPHKLRSMESWDNITSIHGIFVFNEAEAIHELNLGDLAGAMGVEVVLNVGLGSGSREIAQVEARVADTRVGHSGRERFLTAQAEETTSRKRNRGYPSRGKPEMSC